MHPLPDYATNAENYTKPKSLSEHNRRESNLDEVVYGNEGIRDIVEPRNSNYSNPG